MLTHGRSNAGPGGAVLVTGAGAPADTVLVLIRAVVRESTTSFWGGGIAATNAEVQLLYSSVTGNEANGGGGGVNLNGGVLVLFEAEIADNRSGGSGGGIEFWTGELYMDRSVVDRNTAENAGTPPSGGGMSIRDLSVASIQSSRFAGNWSRSSGGGLHVWGTTELFLLQSTFSSNMVFEDVGGGLAILAPAHRPGAQHHGRGQSRRRRRRDRGDRGAQPRERHALEQPERRRRRRRAAQQRRR